MSGTVLLDLSTGSGRRQSVMAMPARVLLSVFVFATMYMMVLPAAASTHDDLVKAVNSTCFLALRLDIELRSNLPDINTARCPEVKIVGRCRGAPCKIDGMGRYTLFRNAQKLILENLEITRTKAAIYYVDELVIRRCRFIRNVNSKMGESAVISLYEAAAVIENSEFAHNSGLQGTIYMDSFSRLEASDVVFLRNKAVKGGAIQNIESKVKCTRCSFHDNEAGDGGAVSMSDQDGTEATFSDSQFVRNKATRRGGKGGAVYIEAIDPGAKFCRCLFEANTAITATGANVLRHMYIEMTLPDSDMTTVTFCPRRPPTGIVFPPSFGPNVQDTCAGCP